MSRPTRQAQGPSAEGPGSPDGPLCVPTDSAAPHGGTSPPMCPPALRGEIRGKGSFLGIALTLVKSVSECLEPKILHSYPDSLRRFSFCFFPGCPRCHALPAPLWGLNLCCSVSECLESKILHSYLDSLRRFSFLVKRKRSGGRGNAPDWRKWLVHPACSGTLQRPGFLLY